jgi:SAM-dependent methyltransferase
VLPVVSDPEGRRYELRPATCPICGPVGTRLVGIRGGRYHRYGLGIESPIARCQQCTLLFPDPFPHALDPQEMYGDPEKYFHLHGEFESRSQERRGMVQEIRRRTGKTDPRILDIGSGRGETLRAAQLEGITTAVGLELSAAMIRAAADRDLTVFDRTAEQYADDVPPCSFDAVVLAAVAEHVPDPDALLAATSRLTASGGVLFIDVPREPNIVTWAAAAVNRARRSPAVVNLSPTFSPYHVYGFNPKALSILLGKHGFALDELRVICSPVIPHDGSRNDRIRALAGSLAIRIGNATRTAPNMSAWARKP